MTLTFKTNPVDVARWLEGHGYSVAIVTGFPEFSGLVFSKGNEAARLAVIGQTLEYVEKTGKVRVI